MVRWSVLILIFAALYLACVSPLNAAATVYPITDSTNYNIRIDGAAAGHRLTGQWYYSNIAYGDFDNDDKQDLLVGSAESDYNSRTNSGSVYIIYGSLLETLTAEGSKLDLSNTAHFNIRIDGAVANDYLGYGLVSAGDINNDGNDDLVVASSAPNISNKGSVHIIYNNILSSYTGTGNIVDLGTSTNWNIRYTGAASSDYTGTNGGKLTDIDGDDKLDLIFGTYLADNNSRADSGSAYIIYNTLIDDYSGTGNTVDLGTGANYNIRLDGATAGDMLTSNSIFAPSSDDFSGDGEPDLALSAIYTDYNSRSNSGSVYLIFSTILDDYSGTGNNIDLAVGSNYNVRIDGPSANRRLAYSSNIEGGDLDNDGINDLLIPNSHDGNIYILYGSLISTFTGTGNTTELGSSSKYSILLTGAEDYLSYYSFSFIRDFNGDGKDDLIAAEGYTNYAGSGDGSVYVLFNDIFSGISGTGNSLSLSSTSNYSLRFDNPTTTGTFATPSLHIVDMNGDGLPDILVGDGYQNYNSRSESGSLWLIYNFPHSLSSTSTSRSGSTVTVEGNVLASSSLSDISGVEYQIDSNNPLTGWTACTADDGTFNSTNEDFTCESSAGPVTVGSHTVYIRAYDVHPSYTSQDSYLTYTYSVAAPTATPTLTPTPTPTVAQESNSSQLDDRQQISSVTGGSGAVAALVEDGHTTQKVIAVVEAGTLLGFNAYLSSSPSTGQSVTTAAELTASIVSPTNSRPRSNAFVVGGGDGIIALRAPTGIAFGISQPQRLFFKTVPDSDSGESAVIIPELQGKPSIIALSYTDADLIPAGDPTHPFSPLRLKLARSRDGITWAILPTSVVDAKNRTVAALDKVYGYYMIVASPPAYRAQPLVLGTSTQLRAEAITDDVSDHNGEIESAVTPGPSRADNQSLNIQAQEAKKQDKSLVQQISGFVKKLLSL